MTIPLVKLESILLDLMTSKHTEHIVVSEEFTDGLLAEKDRALTHVVEFIIIIQCLFIWEWISPHKIAKKPFNWYFLEPVYKVDIFNNLQFRRNAPMCCKVFV